MRSHKIAWDGHNMGWGPKAQSDPVFRHKCKKFKDAATRLL